MFTPSQYRNKFSKRPTTISPETAAYVEWSRQKREEQESRHTPLEWATNLLSAGSNLTANTAENIMDTIRGRSVPVSEYIGDMLKSFTPEGEKSWRKVFWGDEKEGDYQGMFGSGGVSGGSGSTASKVFRGVTGFLGDAILDPANYISFGATSAAKKAASAFAEQKVLHAVSNMTDLSMFSKSFNKAKLEELMKAGKTSEAFQYLSNFARQDGFAKEFEKYYREGLRKSSSQMKDEIFQMIKTEPVNPQQKIVENRINGWINSYDIELKNAERRLAKRKKLNPDEKSTLEMIKSKREMLKQDSQDLLKHGAEAIKGKLSGKKDFIESVPERMKGYFTGKNSMSDMINNADLTGKIDLARWENPFIDLDGAGSTSWKFLRKEINPGEHAGFDAARKQWDALSERFGNSKVPFSSGKTSYSDAWWSLMNNSAVGRVRRLFGSRNAYEEMLNVKARDAAEEARSSIQSGVRQAMDRLSQFTDEDKTDYVLLKSLKEKLGTRKKFQNMDFATFVRSMSGKLKSEIGVDIGKIDNDAIETLVKIDGHMKEIYEKMRVTENIWSAGGYGKGIKERADYINFVSNAPHQAPVGPGTIKGSAEQVFAKKKTRGTYKSLMGQASALRDLTGMDELDLENMIRDNVTSVNTNLDEIVASRIIQHYGYSRRVNIIEAFKPFGLDLKSLPDNVASKLKNPDEAGKIGLSVSGDPSLKNVFFDDHVAAIIDRTGQLMSNDPDQKALVDTFDRFTHLWKIGVTTNPGFHLRNFYSNMTTLFQQHGLDALDFDAAKDSAVATLVGLEGIDEAAKWLSIPRESINAILAKSYGNHTLGELVSYARDKGIISMSFGGRDSKEAIQDLIGIANKGLYEKAGSVSRNTGAHIESFAKMDSFLIGVKRMGKSGDMTPGALDYAKNEAKKWFIDYENLTDFERKYMKGVFPFYTWLRRNVANQVGQIMSIENWPTMALPQKMLKSIKDTTVDEHEMPSYIREEGGIPVGRGDDGDITYLYPQLPINDLNKLPFRPGSTLKETLGNSVASIMDTLQNAAHPAIKSLVSLKDFAEKRSDERKSTEVSGDIEGMFWSISDGLLRLFGSSAMKRSDSGKIMVDSDILSVFRSIAPQVRTIDRLISLPKSATLVASGDTDALMDRVSRGDTNAEKVRLFWEGLSVWAGVRGATMNEGEERYKRAQGIYYEGLREKQAAEKDSLGYKTRSIKNRRQLERTYRRLGIL